MKKVLFLAIATSRIALSLSAQYQAGLELGPIEFHSNLSHIPSLILSLDRGQPLYTVRANQKYKFEDGGEVSFEAILKSFEAARNQMETSFMLGLTLLEKNRRKPSVNAETSTEPAKEEPKETKYVEGFSKGNWQKYCDCAEKSIPVLKTILSLKESSEERGFLIRLLDSERGDGVLVSSLGMVCGKYMGRYGRPSSNLKDDVLTLAALSKKGTKEDTQKLLKLYVLSTLSKSAQSLKARDFWLYAWRKAAFYYTLSSEDIPMESLIGSYLGYRSHRMKSTQVQFAVGVSKDELQKAVTLDWSALEGFATEIEPCS